MNWTLQTQNSTLFTSSSILSHNYMYMYILIKIYVHEYV